MKDSLLRNYIAHARNETFLIVGHTSHMFARILTDFSLTDTHLNVNIITAVRRHTKRRRQQVSLVNKRRFPLIDSYTRAGLRPT